MASESSVVSEEWRLLLFLFEEYLTAGSNLGAISLRNTEPH